MANQIEIYFSILQRKALTPNDFNNLAALAARIATFEAHYRLIAQPFDWTFTRTDLDALLARLATPRTRPSARGIARRTNGRPYQLSFRG